MDHTQIQEPDTAIQESIDIRIKQLSYSSRLLLHSCPRKYQLYKLEGKDTREKEVSAEGSIVSGDSYKPVTFSFGHVVGQGIQDIFQGMPESQVYFRAFLMWEPDLLDEDTKRKKSFWLALIAIKKFIAMRKHGFLEEYEVVTINGKPAAELSFLIHFPDGFTYKGFVDLVLRHKVSGEIMVLEVKTTSGTNVAAASYKNSAQALGYSIVLDVPFPNLSSYKVKYLIYKTKSLEFEVMDFTKDYLSRALWIREILLDVEQIKLYEDVGIYPMHGESCYNYYSECEYMGICTLSTDKFTVPLDQEIVSRIEKTNASDFEINLSLNDLIKSQLAKELV